MDVVLIFIQVSKVERELGGNLSSISASIEASLPENTAGGQRDSEAKYVPKISVKTVCQTKS